MQVRVDLAIAVAVTKLSYRHKRNFSAVKPLCSALTLYTSIYRMPSISSNNLNCVTTSNSLLLLFDGIPRYQFDLRQYFSKAS